MALSGMRAQYCKKKKKKKKKKKRYSKKKNSTRENTVSVTIIYVEAKKNNIFFAKKIKTCAKLSRSGRSQTQRTMKKWIIDLTLV